MILIKTGSDVNLMNNDGENERMVSDANVLQHC